MISIKNKLLLLLPLLFTVSTAFAQDQMIQPQPCDRSHYVCLFDEFINSLGPGGELGWTASGVANTAPITGGFGGVIGTTAATSGAVAYQRLFAASTGDTAPYNATTFDIQVRLSLSATTTVSMLAGVASTINDGVVAESLLNNVIGVAYDTSQGDTGWMCVAKSGGTATRTPIPGATLDTAMHTYRIMSVPSWLGKIRCSQDGGAGVAVTTNVPSAALSIVNSIETQAAVAKSFTIDYWSLIYAITR